MAVVRAKLEADGTVKVRRAEGKFRRAKPRTDWSRVDATTEAEIARQIAEDEAEANRDAARWVRRVRRKVGLSQNQFATRVGVSVATLRNWEQGKRFPRGPARALLRIIDHAPEAALAGLGQ